MAMLEDLVELYPFSTPLHVSYAYALKKFKPEKYEGYIAKASIHTPNRSFLYKVIHNISDFENSVNTFRAPEVEDVDINQVNSSQSEFTLVEAEDSSTISTSDDAEISTLNSSEQEAQWTPFEDGEIIEESDDRMDNAEGSQYKDPVFTIEPPAEEDGQNHTEIAEANFTDGESSFIIDVEGIEELKPVDERTGVKESEEAIEDVSKQEEPLNKNPQKNEFHNTIETVIPDFEHPAYDNTFHNIASVALLETKTGGNTPAQNEIIGNIASTDYFVFDQSVVDPLQSESPEQMKGIAGRIQNRINESGEETLTRYDDDKMPFSFLWWLDKTRK
jgi:hypothetical protein